MGIRRIIDLYRTYFDYVPTMAWLAATSGNVGTIDVERIVQRLADSGEHGVTRQMLYASLDRYYADQKVEEYVTRSPDRAARQRPYNAPFEDDEDVDNDEPEARTQRPWRPSDMPELGSNRKRRSQSQVGRHERQVRARAARLGVTEAVADRDMVHRDASYCSYRNPALRSPGGS
jgi:hypothetical protein